MQYAYSDIPSAAYPFTVYAYRESSALDVDPVWEATVAGPGPLYIPPLSKLVGEPVRVVIHYADGTVERDLP